jgi:hypothetical protein
MGVSYLACGESSNHEKTSTDTAERTFDTKLLGDLDQTASGALSWKTLSLVDFAQHGVGGLGNGSGSETSHETGTKVNDSLHSIGGLALVNSLVDGLSNLLVNDELRHGVWNPENLYQYRSLVTL